jgi:uncharacterized protein YbcI
MARVSHTRETEEGQPCPLPTQDTSRHGGELNAAISNAVVALLSEYTGRGPTKAQTTIRNNVVVVLLHDTLTKGERALVSRGREDKVLELRSEFQSAMREEAMDVIGRLTGRKVTAFMSANHIDPDLAAEMFVLDGRGDVDAVLQP